MGDLFHSNKGRHVAVVRGIVFIVVLVGVAGIFLFSSQREKQNDLKELYIQFTKQDVIEYGSKNINAKDLIKKYTGTLTKLPKLDTDTVGKVKLTFTITKGKASKQYTREIEIKDTKNPSIVVKQEALRVQINGTVDFQSNVLSVEDPVDGDLSYSDKAIKTNGYYIDEGNFDVTREGTYEIFVFAMDRNGNKNDKKFNVIVEKDASEIKEEGQSANSSTIQQTNPATPSVNTPTQDSSNNNAPVIDPPVQPSPPVLCPGGRYPEKACNISISHPSLVPSNGVYYDTEEEAWNVGDALGRAGKITGFDETSVTFNDESVKWIIIFH